MIFEWKNSNSYCSSEGRNRWHKKSFLAAKKGPLGFRGFRTYFLLLTTPYVMFEWKKTSNSYCSSEGPALEICTMYLKMQLLLFCFRFLCSFLSIFSGKIQLRGSSRNSTSTRIFMKRNWIYWSKGPTYIFRFWIWIVNAGRNQKNQ